MFVYHRDDWETYVPYTNVLWIRYLIDKIMNVKQYTVKNSSIQRNTRTLLRRILWYHSALDMMLSLDCMFPSLKMKYFMHEWELLILNNNFYLCNDNSSLNTQLNFNLE